MIHLITCEEQRFEGLKSGTKKQLMVQLGQPNTSEGSIGLDDQVLVVEVQQFEAAYPTHPPTLHCARSGDSVQVTITGTFEWDVDRYGDCDLRFAGESYTLIDVPPCEECGGLGYTDNHVMGKTHCGVCCEGDDDGNT